MSCKAFFICLSNLFYLIRKRIERRSQTAFGVRNKGGNRGYPLTTFFSHSQTTLVIR